MSSLRTPMAAAAAALIGVLSPSSSAAQSAARDATQAAVDSEGRLRPPTAEERHQLNEARRAEQRQAQDPAPVRRADGSLHAELPEHLESISVARVEDGNVVTRCFDNRADAEAFLGGAQAAPALEEK